MQNRFQKLKGRKNHQRSHSQKITRKKHQMYNARQDLRAYRLDLSCYFVMPCTILGGSKDIDEPSNTTLTSPISVFLTHNSIFPFLQINVINSRTNPQGFLQDIYMLYTRNLSLPLDQCFLTSKGTRISPIERIRLTC